MSLADFARFGLVHARTVGRSMARPMCESIRPIRRMRNLLIPARPMARQPAIQPVQCRKRQTSRVVLAAQGSIITTFVGRFEDVPQVDPEPVDLARIQRPAS